MITERNIQITSDLYLLGSIIGGDSLSTSYDYLKEIGNQSATELVDKLIEAGVKIYQERSEQRISFTLTGRQADARKSDLPLDHQLSKGMTPVRYTIHGRDLKIELRNAEPGKGHGIHCRTTLKDKSHYLDKHVSTGESVGKKVNNVIEAIERIVTEHYTSG